MDCRSDELNAALSFAFGAGHLETITHEAMRRAGLGAGADPHRITVELGNELRPMSRLATPYEVQGRRVLFRWDRDGEWAVNLLLGNGEILLLRSGITVAPSRLWRVASILAVPDPDEYDPRQAASVPYPAWFLKEAAQRPRGARLSVQSA